VSDRQRLSLAFVANVLMFLIGLVGWRLGQSAALLGDALDMLADASGYAIAFLAVGGSVRQKQLAARWNGAMLMILGASLAVEVARQWVTGHEPRGGWIMAFAALSLLVNGAVLRLLKPYRTSDEVHLRAAWVDTRADVLVNVGVLISGALVSFTGYRVIDLAVGALLAVFVVREGWEIWEGDDDDD
jgi:cation diffusion facilitator family transporter